MLVVAFLLAAPALAITRLLPSFNGAVAVIVAAGVPPSSTSWSHR